MQDQTRKSSTSNKGSRNSSKAPLDADRIHQHDVPPEAPNGLESLKLSALKELAYGASHEINNPLANIAARAQTLLRDEAAPERRYALEAIHRQAMRAHEMISDLMLFARPPALVTEMVDLRSIVEGVLEELAEPFQHRAVRFLWKRPDESMQCQGAFDCMGDPGQLAVAIMAVCTNSLEAIGTGGEVAVSLGHQISDRLPAGQHPTAAAETAAPTEWLVLEIADDGPGISETVRPHLFDPFFSGREAGRGLGFGLSKCWRIITQHGGSVDASNRSETSPATPGAIVTICLPACKDPSSENSALN